MSLIRSPEEESVVEYVGSADIWAADEPVTVTKPVEARSQSDSSAKVMDRSKLGFCVGVRDRQAETKVGDIIHLMIPPATVLTVVRRIVSSDKYAVVAGVEVLGYDAELLHIMDIDNQGPKTACVLTNIEGVESIVIKVDEFKNEEFLYVDRNDKILRYRVEKILSSSTSMFKHLKVSLS